MFGIQVIELEFDLTGEENTNSLIEASLDNVLITLPLINPFRLIARKGDKVLITADSPNRAIVMQVQHHISQIKDA